MATVVTATQSGVTANGLILRVRCVTGADTLANIAAGTCKGSQSGAAGHNVALTTTRIGSVVWCAMENANAGANNPSAGNSSLDDVPDATNGQQYGTIFQTTPTVTPGAFTSGSADSFPGGAAAIEILPAISGGTIAYDSSGPALAQTFAATTIATASFTPPPGALLMAVVSSNAGTGVGAMTVSDTLGLTWTQVVVANATSEKYAGIWLAQVPAASGASPLLIAHPGRTWLRRFKHRQTPPQPIQPFNVSVTGVVSDTPSSSPVGTVGIGVIGAVPSTVTSASPVGTVSVGVIGQVANTLSASPVGLVTIGVTGQVSNVTNGSPVGTVTLISNVSVIGVVSNTTSASPVGTVGVGVIGVASNTTSASPVGTPKIGVTGVVSNVNSASPIGTVKIALTGVVSNTTSASPIGTVGIGKIGLVSNVVSASPVGSVTTTSNVNVIGAAPDTVTSASPIGSVTTFTPRQIEDFGGSEADTNVFGGTALDSNAFGGTALADLFDGSASVVTLGGTATKATPVYGGTAADANVFGGTATDANNLGGTQIGFTMQVQNITVGEFNDELIDIAITASGSAFNLTGFTLKAYLKTAAGVDDADPSTIVLSSSGGSPAITIISASAGTASVRIARADLGASSDIGFWRVDVIDSSSNQNTAIFGAVTVTSL